MKNKTYICEHCSEQVSDKGTFCSGCGSVFDADISGVSIRVTKQDVDTISSFLNIMLKNRVVFKDVMRYLRSLSKSYGVNNLDSIDMRNKITTEILEKHEI